jgi:3-hydroxyacyl-CoA dehydrogenase/enoyl-CoA hydratase/3-hydroxybutyryl-CoA epimerase
MRTFSQEILEGKIVLLTFNTPGKNVNIFTPDAMTELEQCLTELTKRTDLQALLFISGKKDHFCAGADINILAEIHDRETGYQLSRRGQAVFSLFPTLPFPSIAAINGVCVGGGTELALACSYRLASDHPGTKISLPEVTIGIIPGWGGSQRLPRLIGVQRSLDFILTGRRLDARRAHQLGLVDRVISSRSVLQEALNFVKVVIAGEDVRTHSRRHMRTFLDRIPFGKRILYLLAQRNIYKKTLGNYPAPALALAAICEGLKKPLAEGMQIEANYFKQLVDSPVSKNLIRVFFWRDAIKKECERTTSRIPTQEIFKAAILGPGLMGIGLSQLLAAHEISTCLKGVREETLTIARKQIGSVRTNDRIRYTVSFDGFKALPFVIESIRENMTAKKQALSELERQVDEETIIASNTSSLGIAQLAAALQKPGRFIGMHFFNPPWRTQLVEIIPGIQTSEKTRAAALKLARQLGKLPLVVKDRPGFLVNRILAPLLLEALILRSEGKEQRRLDDLMKKFGLYAGPFEMIDAIGIDIALAVAKNLANGQDHSEWCVAFLEKMSAAGYIGKKAGLGFYRYKKKSKRVNRKTSVFLCANGKDRPADDISIRRMVYVMINEAARCLQEQIVRQARDIDAAMIFAIGFAPFRGGLLTYADNEGISRIVGILEEFADHYGPRFKPCGLLYDLQKDGKTFYSWDRL